MNGRVISNFCARFVLAAVIVLLSHTAVFPTDIVQREKELSIEQTVTIENPSSDDPNQTAPNIDFSLTKHDFGRINSGENPKTAFSFKNSGNETLVIKKVKGG